MGYQEELTRIQEAKASMRQSIINKGVDVPEDAKIEMYPDYIAQIVGGGGGYDPNNPTLEGLKAAIDAGDYAAFPVGTEIPDTYDGNSNPLIVAQYLDSTNNSAYGGAEGVILVRKYVEPTSQQFGSSVDYATSVVRTFLDTTYLNSCSDELKSVISELRITTYRTLINSKWFLMSGVEMGGAYSHGEGFFWDYWKQKTGLSSPNANANVGRVLTDRVGTSHSVWSRSKYMFNVYYVQTSGSFGSDNYTKLFGVLPACFIAKS